MNGFVQHCGRCGRALPCACQAVAVQVQPVLPPPNRFVKQGGYMVCTVCKLAEEWCGCAKAPPPPPTPDSTLIERIRTLKGGPT